MFKPIRKINEYISVWYDSKWHHFNIIYIEPLPPSYDTIKDFGSISNGSSLSNQKLDLIELDDLELGQFRFKVLDDIQVTVFQPKASKRFAIKNTTIRVDKLSQLYDPDLEFSEIFVYKDKYPYVDVENNSGEDLSKTRIIFFGYRFVLEELEVEPSPDETYYVVSSGRK